jgi:SAM-dependent methyltransferase
MNSNHTPDQQPIRINVGCGAQPTLGWMNFDNSPAVRLGRLPLFGAVMATAPLLGAASRELAAQARRHDIRWADSQRLPLPDGSVAIYHASHMLEHMDHQYAGDTRHAVLEAYRVLRPGGILRLVVPDLAHLARRYTSGEIDADQFMVDSSLTTPSPRGFGARLKAALVGPRHHQWMFDAKTLSELASSCGFAEIKTLPPGQTRIADPGALDLRERADEGSVYLEATRA